MKNSSTKLIFKNIYFGLILIGFTTMLIYGCQDLPSTIIESESMDLENDRERFSSQPGVNFTNQFLQRANSHFFDLSELVPGFGGIYLEEKGTKIVIRTTESVDHRFQEIENDVRNYLENESPTIAREVDGGVQEMEIRFEEAEYEYLELFKWQDRILVPVLDSEGVISLSISHSQNRIKVGLEEERFRQHILEIVRSKSVSENAVTFSVTGHVINDRSHHTLRDLHRPLVGGLENNLYNSSGTILRGACTYGFNVWWSSERHWVTNSHCTREIWSVFSSDQYYQSSISDGSAGYVGSEAYDPGSLGSSVCPGSLPCRYSDAALIELPSNQSWDFGEIAKTEYGSFPGQGNGSLVIDSNDPRFFILADASDNLYYEGMWATKVGRTTGWTNGQVTDTCVHVNNNIQPIGNFRLLCQEFTNYHSAGGDSGSPVFNRPFNFPNEARLTGIHWGRFSVSGERIFSRITGIKEDLGNFTTH
ncbi:MAG: hypothetical protein WD355_10650 [Balneolaceae bacterium]